MVFVTIGTQEPFDRFIKIVDDIAASLPDNEEVVAQICHGQYQPRHMKAVNRVSPDEFDNLMRCARLIVAHAGMGTILTAMQMNKPIVVFPRKASLGEHRNDHQTATAEMLMERGWAYVAQDAESLHTLMHNHTLAPKHTIGTQASPELAEYILSLIP